MIRPRGGGSAAVLGVLAVALATVACSEAPASLPNADLVRPIDLGGGRTIYLE